MKIKKLFITKKIFAVFLFTMIVIPLFSINTYASGIILEANSNGLEFFKSAGTEQLIDVSNMTPGDTIRAQIEMKSNVDFAFVLSVEIKNLTENKGINPAKNFIITFYRDGEILATFGNLSKNEINVDLPSIGDRYPLENWQKKLEGLITQPYPFKHTYKEKFVPGSAGILEFEIHLLGPETGNEYQSQSAQLQWIFTATADEPPPTTVPETTAPQTGSTSSEATTAVTAESTSGISETIAVTLAEETYSPAVQEETGAVATEIFENISDASIPLGGLSIENEQTAEPSTAEISARQPADDNDNEDNIVSDETTEPEYEEFLDEPIPLGYFEMPKTGEPPLYYNLAGGAAMVFTGSAIALKMQKGEKRRKLKRK